jgi:hypothetical protein
MNSDTGSKKAAVDVSEYEALLNMKAQFEEQQKLSQANEQKNQELAKELEEAKKSLNVWESIGSTLGGSDDPKASQAALDALKAKEIEKFLSKLREIMPELEKTYSDFGPVQKKWADRYMQNFRAFLIDSDTLRQPKALDGARGMVELMTQASRNHNARFTEQEAKIQELKRKHEESVREKEEIKKKMDEAVRRAEYLSQSGTSKSIAPSVVPPSTTSTPPESRSTGLVTPRAPYEQVSNTIETTASSSSPSYSYVDGIKRVKVTKDGEEHEIEVAPWNVRQGYYSSFGDQLSGNQTFAWLEQGIKNGTFLKRGQSAADISAGSSRYKNVRDFQFSNQGYTPW